MSRVIAFLACGFTLAACSSSLPSMDFFKSSPVTETLRIESEPPGADAKTTQGQACRTPCELTVQPGSDLAVTVALNGYQPQTVALKTDAAAKLAPNPVYVELQVVPPVAPAKKKPVAKKRPAATAAAQPAPAQTAAPAPAPTAEPAPSAAYPWPTSR